MMFFFSSFGVEPNELVDQILAQENNIALTKKLKKAYELNKQF